MDILNPDLVWIEGRCYRNLAVEKSDVEPKEQRAKTRVREEYRNDENECDADLPIQHDGNRFHISIALPAPFVGHVVGKKGATCKSIENQTDTQIRVPQVRNQDDKDIDVDVVIVGRQRQSVASAYNRITAIVTDARGRSEYTHFISIPTNSSSIQAGFNTFKKEVLSKYRCERGISEGIFTSTPKLHLTIAMLTLLSHREKEKAASLLQKNKEDILHLLGNKPLQIEVKGVEYMNDDPSEVDVLFGKVKEADSDSCLQMIANKLAHEFALTDFSRKEGDNVKLHVTLMKSKSANGARVTFDARKILQNFAEYSFGQMTVTEIHISVRYTGGNTSYYTPGFILNIAK